MDKFKLESQEKLQQRLLEQEKRIKDAEENMEINAKNKKVVRVSLISIWPIR